MGRLGARVGGRLLASNTRTLPRLPYVLSIEASSITSSAVLMLCFWYMSLFR